LFGSCLELASLEAAGLELNWIDLEVASLSSVVQNILLLHGIITVKQNTCLGNYISNVNVEQSDVKLTCSQGSLCVVCGSQRSPRRGFQGTAFNSLTIKVCLFIFYIFLSDSQRHLQLMMPVVIPII
jgi:hypothetical protein